jgi:hypothetical protein
MDEVTDRGRLRQFYSRVVFGISLVWALMSTLGAIVGAFTIGKNDTAPEVIAIFCYIMSYAPACFLAFWKRRFAAFWLTVVVCICSFGFLYQNLHQREFSLTGIVVSIVPMALLVGFMWLSEARKWPAAIGPSPSYYD